MAHPGLPGGVARPCALRSAAVAGWGPRAAPASLPEPALNMTVLALSSRCDRRLKDDWLEGEGDADVGVELGRPGARNRHLGGVEWGSRVASGCAWARSETWVSAVRVEGG